VSGQVSICLKADIYFPSQYHALCQKRAFLNQDSCPMLLTPIVVSFREHGFGPYAKVLVGLYYNADHKGMIPHSNVAIWVQNQAASLRLEAQGY